MVTDTTEQVLERLIYTALAGHPWDPPPAGALTEPPFGYGGVGWNDGAGNPPNPSGIKTDWLWREVPTRGSLTNTLENYAQLEEAREEMP